MYYLKIIVLLELGLEIGCTVRIKLSRRNKLKPTKENFYLT